jgi:predicted ArsR family transcriptional regulator
MLADLSAYLTGKGEADLLRGFFDDQGEERARMLRERIGHLEGRERLEGLATIMSEEGFMADVTDDDEGRPTLRLANCPIRPLIDVTRAPCRSELGSVQAFLGARLVRTSYIPDGDAACCYTIEAPEPGKESE